MKKKVNVKGNIRRMALLVAGCVVMGGMAASQTGGNMAYAMTKEEAERQKDDASENEKNAKDVLDSLEEQQNKIVQDVADLDAKYDIRPDSDNEPAGADRRAPDGDRHNSEKSG